MLIKRCHKQSEGRTYFYKKIIGATLRLHHFTFYYFLFSVLKDFFLFKNLSAQENFVTTILKNFKHVSSLQSSSC